MKNMIWIVAVIGLLELIVGIIGYRKIYLKEKDDMGILFLFGIGYGILAIIAGTTIQIMIWLGYVTGA